MARIKLSPPWDIFYREINAMFEHDPEVNVLYDEDERTVKLYVANPRKASALAKIMPTEKEFGNVTMYIEVIPPNGVLSASKGTILDAFEGNGAFSRIREAAGSFEFNAVYVLFVKKVVQFFTDNLGDYNGMKSTLYEDIARDIFNVDGDVFFCTELKIMDKYQF